LFTIANVSISPAEIVKTINIDNLKKGKSFNIICKAKLDFKL
jgi:hypothetical protein